MRDRWVKRGVKIAMFVPVVIVVVGFIFMTLWNSIVPPVFGGHTIGFWQAWGIIILSKILFGGFRGRPGYGGSWKRRMRDRWEQMTPEEREKIQQGMPVRCGSSAPGQA